MKKFKSEIMKKMVLVNEAESIEAVEKLVKDAVKELNRKGEDCTLLKVEEVIG